MRSWADWFSEVDTGAFAVVPAGEKVPLGGNEIHGVSVVSGMEGGERSDSMTLTAEITSGRVSEVDETGGT